MSCSTAQETYTGSESGGSSFAGGGTGGSGATSTWTRSNPPGLQIIVDLYNDKVTAILSGQNKTGPLNISIVGAGQTTTLLNSSATSGSSVNSSLGRTSLNPGQYTAVVATWDDLSLTKPVSFKVLGSTRFSTYNVPVENSCSGTPTPVYIFENDTNSCLFYPATLMNDFTIATNENGTGLSKAYGLLRPWGTTWLAKYCPVPTGAGATQATTFVRVGSNVNNTVGSCNSNLSPGTSLATNPNPSPSNTAWTCNDNVLLVNTGNDQTDSVKVVQDYCPACSSGFGPPSWGNTVAHIDTFSSYTSCSSHSASDYGNFTAIRLR